MEAAAKEFRIKLIGAFESALKYLVPIFYFAITIAFYLKTYDSAQIKITILQVGGVAIAAIWLLKILEENSNPFENNLVITAPLLIYLALGYFSIVHSDYPGTTLDEFIRRNVYIVLSLVIVKEFNSGKKINLLINLILIAAFVSAFYGIIQYLDYVFYPKSNQPTMNPERLDPFIWRQAFSNRIFSTHGNPNFFGNFLVIVSPMILAGFLRKKTANYAMLFVMVAFCIWKTGSKGAWLGFASGITIFIFLAILYFPVGKSKVVKRVAAIMMVLIVLGASFFVWKKSQERMDSLGFRVHTWLSTWEMIEIKPILGTGLGTFKTTYPAYRRPEIFHIEGKSNTETDHPEDEFIEVLYDDGIVGFGLFMWIVVLFTTIGLKMLSRFSSMVTVIKDKAGNVREVLEEPRAYYMLGILSAFLGMLFHNLFDVSLRFVSSGVFLWLLIGIIGSLAFNHPLPAEAPMPKPFVPEKAIIPEKFNFFRRLLQIGIIVGAGFLMWEFWGYFKADMHHNRGIFFSKQKKWKEAMEHYGEVVRLNPNFIMAHYFMGNVYNDRWQDGDGERALEKYDDVKALAPNYVQVHHQTGNVYVKIGKKLLVESQRLDKEGKPDAAAEARKKALENYNLALESYQKYWKLDPVFQPNFYRMAMIYMDLDDLPKAEEMYRAGLVHNPKYVETHINLGNVLYLQNKLPDAEKTYRKAMELSPGNLQAMKNLTAVYRKMNRRDDEIKLWRTIAQRYPEDPDVKRVFNRK